VFNITKVNYRRASLQLCKSIKILSQYIVSIWKILRSTLSVYKMLGFAKIDYGLE
jgi:hypothetical protein